MRERERKVEKSRKGRKSRKNCEIANGTRLLAHRVKYRCAGTKSRKAPEVRWWYETFLPCVLAAFSINTGPRTEADLDAWLAQGGDAEDSSDGEDEYAACGMDSINTAAAKTQDSVKLRKRLPDDERQKLQAHIHRCTQDRARVVLRGGFSGALPV